MAAVPTDWLMTLLPKHGGDDGGERPLRSLALPKIPADPQGPAIDHRADRGRSIRAGDRVERRRRRADERRWHRRDNRDRARRWLGRRLQQSDVRARHDARWPRGSRDQTIKVTRAWEPKDNGLPAHLDEDGVASLQLDPGAPVNIVIPALPYRAQPPPQARVTCGEPPRADRQRGAPSLADQVEMDKWLGAAVAAARSGIRSPRVLAQRLRCASMRAVRARRPPAATRSIAASPTSC